MDSRTKKTNIYTVERGPKTAGAIALLLLLELIAIRQRKD